MVVNVLLRSEKGSALTHNEVDQNFIDLQDAVNLDTVYTSSTAPSVPADYPLWFDSVNEKLKFYFDDGVSPAWVDVIPAGIDGKTVLNGTSNPTTQGVNGDFYINTSNYTIFGPKTGVVS